MDKKLLIDNKKYISSKDAGNISGYTNDYVARLARQGKVLGKKVGRAWYVEEESLNNFIEDNKIQKTQLHKKLSDKRINDYKYSERGRKVSEVFESFKLQISQTLKAELFKKGIAFVTAITLVVGGYFAVNTDIAKAGFKKVAQVAQISLDAVSKFDATDFSEDVALNIYRGMNKTKSLAEQVSDKTYLLAVGDSATWSNLKNIVDSTIDQSVAFINIGAEDVAIKSFDGMANIFASYESLRDTQANVFASALGNINTILRDEAVYVNSVINNVICNKFSTLKLCKEDTQKIKKETVLVQTKKDSVISEDINTEVVVAEKPSVVAQAPKTVINQPVIERIVETERVLTVSGISQDNLDTAIEQLKNKVYSDMYSLTSSNESKIINTYTTIAHTNKIDKLGNVTISNSSITSSSFSGTEGSFSGALSSDTLAVSGELTADSASISGNITAGSITTTGPITFSGLGTDMLLSTDSSGNIIATSTPQFASFIATSTTATSTIAGGLAIETSGFVYDYSTNNVGIGTASPRGTFDVGGTAGSAGMLIDSNSFVSISNNDAGTSNTIFGRLAGDAIISGGNFNTLFGENVGGAITTGDDNTAMGYDALTSNTTGYLNTAIGKNALKLNTGGWQNVIIGSSALSNSSSAGNFNVAVGNETLVSSSGNDNTAIGYRAISSNTTGYRNTAIGLNTLFSFVGLKAAAAAPDQISNLEIIGQHTDHHTYEFPKQWHKLNNGYKGQQQNIYPRYHPICNSYHQI